MTDFFTLFIQTVYNPYLSKITIHDGIMIFLTILGLIVALLALPPYAKPRFKSCV